MAVVITSVSPPRARAGDQVVITGSGFHATPGSNTATWAGQACTIVAGTVTSLTVTLAASGLGSDDLQKALVVTNTGDATSATHYLFFMKPATDYITHRLQAQQPGPDEDPATEVSTVAEAKDYERLASYTESHVRDLLPAAGTPGGTPVTNPTAGAERIGTSPAGFSQFTPARSTVQAALEAIDARMGDIASDQALLVVAKVYSETATLEKDVISTVLAAEGDELDIQAFGTSGPSLSGNISLSIFGHADVVFNPAATGAAWWIKAKVQRLAVGCLVIAEFSNGAVLPTPIVITETDGLITVVAPGSTTPKAMAIYKTSAP